MADKAATVIKDWLNSSLPQIKHPKFKGCKRVTEVQVGDISEQVMKVVSDTFRVVITMEMQDGRTSCLKGIAKMESTGGGLGLANECDFYRTEMHMYNEVIPAMERVMLEKGADKLDFFWPNCYHCSDNKFIFEDLCESGYRLIDTKDMMDLDQIKVAMATVGKYHGMSLVLNERGELDKTKLNKNIYCRNVATMTNVFRTGFNALADIIASDWEPKWSTVPEKLKNLSKTFLETMSGLVRELDGKCDVVIHGDFTLKNVMFLYQGSTTPLDAKLIDFQGCAYTNLAFDLVNILYTSVLPQVRESNIDALLHTHWSSLSETCKKMGYKGTVPTLQDTTSWFRSLAKCGLVLSIFALPVFLAAGEKDFELDLSIFNETDQETDKCVMNKSFYNLPKVKGPLQYELQRGLDENIL